VSSPETIDATRRRWILPYARIERALREKGSAKVILSGEGEATDLQVWAALRGYRVARSLRTAVGIEVVLEAPREQAPPAAPRAASTPAGGQAAGQAGGPQRVEARATGDRLEEVSARMEDPLFRVDLLLASTPGRGGEASAPTSVEAIAKIASEQAGSGKCAHVEATHSSGARFEMLACEGRVEGIVAETGGGKLRGSRALEELSGLLREGRVSYQVRIVDRGFVEKLKG